jgi:glycosyltransferase involved in cell wall biosynthesis
MTAVAPLWLIDHAPIMGGAEQLVLKLACHAALRGSPPVVVVCPPHSELARRCRAADVELRTIAMAHFASAGAVLIGPAIVRLARLLRRAPAGAGLVACSAWSQALLAACGPLLPGRPIVHLLAEQDTARRASARLALSHVGVPVAIGSNVQRVYEAALRGTVVASIGNVLSADELAAAAGAPRREGRRPEAGTLAAAGAAGEEGQRPEAGTLAAAGAAGEEGRRPEAAGTLVVGALARQIPEKGVLELVDELAACPGAWGHARLAGDAQDLDYAARVKRRIEDRGLDARIRVEGRVESVAGFLDGLDVLVVPSIGTEGQPTVALEALARGAGVVMREPIYSDDYRGLPVAVYRDASDLGTALASVPRTPAALDEVARRFGPDQALDGLLAAARTPAALRRR